MRPMIRIVVASALMVVTSVVLFVASATISVMMPWTPSGAALSVYRTGASDGAMIAQGIVAARRTAWYVCGVLPTLVGVAAAGLLLGIRVSRSVVKVRQMAALVAVSILGFGAWIVHSYDSYGAFGIWPWVGILGYSAFLSLPLLKSWRNSQESDRTADLS